MSQQARRRERIHEWKRFVADCARQHWTSSHTMASGPVAVQIVYLCEEAAVDLDNILKPIIDALIGIALDDDRSVTDIVARCRHRRSWAREGIASALASSVSDCEEFVYVRVEDGPPMEELQ
ncbi:MAG: RusA family crossover junction endodeoxyribonuclease [Thermodesulfobacteriota bacterium]